MRRFLGFAFALRAAFCIAALMQAAESKDALFLVLEMSLITAGILLASWPFRIALMPAVFMEALQLSSLCMTGFYTDPNTIQNIGLTETVGSAAYAAAAIAVGYLVLWIPDFCISRCTTRAKAFLRAAPLLVLALLAAVPLTPNRLFLTTLQEAWDCISFRMSNDMSIKDSFARRFDPTPRIPDGLRCKGCNVILIFAEGTSSRILSESLTPNSAGFLRNAFRVKRYYNHQAATFRGIRGTLTSGFTLKGGSFQHRGFTEISEEELLADYSGTLESLPSLLNNAGYRTVFLSPHHEDDALAPLMKAVGFDTAECIKTQNVDSQTYEILFDRAEALDRESAPFFLSAYIFGTHHGLDTQNCRYGDGSNTYFNKFHCQDLAFGAFLKRFFASPLAKNTVLIWTTDHATFPSTEFRRSFHAEVEFFHDEIPLAIHSPNESSRRRAVFNARHRTSITLAPTVLDILDIAAPKTHFLGNSLFATPTSWERYCAQGYRLFRVEDSGMVRRTHDSGVQRKLRLFYSFSG